MDREKIEAELKELGIWQQPPTFRQVLNLFLKLTDNPLDAVINFALFQVPDDVREYINSNVHIILPTNEESIYIPNHVIREKHIIGFPTTLLQPPRMEAVLIVLHEFAHAWLGHKTLKDGLTLEESDKQEEEAWTLARQWMLMRGEHEDAEAGGDLLSGFDPKTG